MVDSIGASMFTLGVVSLLLSTFAITKHPDSFFVGIEVIGAYLGGWVAIAGFGMMKGWM